MGVLSAQDAPVLKINGLAEIKVRPDMTVVDLAVNSENSEYSVVVQDLSDRIANLVKELGKIGFEEEEIKTSMFNINPIYEYESGQRSQTGYRGYQNLTVRFAEDKDMLIKVLNCAANSESDPQISLSFEISRELREKKRTELIKMAVKDARSKADLISGESGYSVSGIKEIQYGSNSGIPSPPIYEQAAFRELEDASFSAIEPENQSLAESVYIIYTLQKS